MRTHRPAPGHGAAPKPRLRHLRWVQVGLATTLAVIAAAAFAGHESGPRIATHSAATGQQRIVAADSSTPAPDRDSTAAIEQSEISGTLDRANAALAGRSRTGFVAQFSAADPALRTRAAQLYDNLVKLPLTQARFVCREVTSSAAHPVKAAARVAFVHQIAGVDPVPVQEMYSFGFTRPRPGGAITITGFGDGKDTSERRSYYPAPWDLGVMTVEIRPHVVVITPGTIPVDAALYADRAETAAAFDLASWTGPAGAAQRFLVTLTMNSSQLSTLYGARDATTDSFEGLEVPIRRAEPALGGGRGENQFPTSRILLSPVLYDDPLDFIAEVMRHEMSHALVEPFDQSSPPLWVIEGFAEWNANSYRPVSRSGAYYGFQQWLGAHSLPTGFPTDEMITNPDVATSNAGYVLSGLVFRFIAETYGHERADRFIVDVYRNSGNLDAAIADATGLDRASFLTGWRAYVRDTT